MMMAAGQPLMRRPHSSDTLKRRLPIPWHSGSFGRRSGSSCFPWLQLAVYILVVSGESSAMSATTMGGQETATVELSSLHDTGGGAVMKLEVGESRLLAHRADCETTPTTSSHRDDGRTAAVATPSSTRPHTSPLGGAADSCACARATVGIEATSTTRPHSENGRTPAASTVPSAHPDTPTHEGAVGSLFWRLTSEEKGSRLRQAAYEGAVEEVRALLAAGADVGARSGLDWTALHNAAYGGHVEVACCLLQAGAEVDARSWWQSTALNVAARNGHAAVVRLLLASSADPNARVKSRWTPLHWAASDGYAEVATALLEAGANRGARNDEGRTPLDLARENNQQQLIQMLESL